MITFKGICQLNNKRNYGFQTLTGSLLIVKMKRAKGVPETTAFREEHISTKVASAKNVMGYIWKVAQTVCCESASKECEGSHSC